MAAIMFETFEVNNFQIGITPVMTLYGNGKSTGLCIDSGYGKTQISPVFEGFVIPNAVKNLDIAGYDLTQYLQRLITQTTNVSLNSFKYM